MKPFIPRTVIFSLIIGMLLIFNSYGEGEDWSEESIVKHVSHLPERLGLEDSLTVVLELQNISNISNLEIFICSMDPLFCFYADNMDYVGNNTFESTIEYQDQDFKAGTVLGYNFKITFKNTTEEKFPNGPTFEDHQNILEADEGIYYFTVIIGEGTFEDDNGEDTGSIIIYLVVLISIVALILGAVVIYPMISKRKK